MFIDLTLEVSERTPSFPGDPPAKIEPLSTYKETGIVSRRLTFNSHFSTHIDAPFHMLPKGKKLEAYPIGHFIGEARVVDVRGVKEISGKYIPKLGGVPFVLFHTGHSRRVFERNYFKNNPVLTESAAQELIHQKVRIVGIDSFTPDNEPYTIHKILFEKEILILENLVNLDQVGERCRLIVAPLNLRNADGAPTRVIAEIS